MRALCGEPQDRCRGECPRTSTELGRDALDEWAKSETALFASFQNTAQAHHPETEKNRRRRRIQERLGNDESYPI